MRGGLVLSLVLAVGAGGCDRRAVQVSDAAKALADGGVTVPTDPKALGDLTVRACVLAATCAKVNGVSASQCIDWFAGVDWPTVGYDSIGPSRWLADRLLACGAKHDGHSCEAFVACFGGSWIGLSLCRRFAGCEGDVLTDDQGRTLDCEALGGTCVTVPPPYYMQVGCCALGPCPEPDWVPNPGTTCTSSTAGCHHKFSHYLGVSYDFDCGPSGRVCTTDAQQLCAGTGAACDQHQAPVCSGSVVSYCFAGRLASYDCAKNPIRSACSDLPGAVPPCQAAGSECDPPDPDICQDGSNLLVCIDGHRRGVDCTALGFGSCSAGLCQP